MNVTLNSLIGAANNITRKSNTKVDQGASEGSASKDRIEIESRVNSKFDSIQVDLRDTQNNLTKNQIINDGLAQIKSDNEKGTLNLNKIYQDFTFNNDKVLMDFLQGKSEIDSEYLNAKMFQNSEDLKGNVESLRKLQIQSENIYASRLIDDTKVDNIVKNFGTQSNQDVHNLNSDVVMRLTR